LCVIAAVLSVGLRKQPHLRPMSAGTTDSREMEIEAETASDLTP
jgi:hypothetical protein